jgi:hypothetical protein
MSSAVDISLDKYSPEGPAVRRNLVGAQVLNTCKFTCAT